MFETYKKDVLEYYFQLKASNQLSHALENPKREKLRKECLRIFSTKNSKFDRAIIQEFFDPLKEFDDHITSIERFELDRFRPLIAFLTKGTNIRNEEPVKLLAWLINFDSYPGWRTRKGIPNGIEVNEYLSGAESNGKASEKEPERISPTNYGKLSNSPSSSTQSPETSDCGPVPNNSNGFLDVASPANRCRENTKLVVDEKLIPKIPGDNSRAHAESNRPSSLKRIIIVSIIFILTIGIGTFLKQGIQNSRVRKPLPIEKCMYWTGSHYQPIRCNTTSAESRAIPLDMKTLKYQRKINWPDTLTKQSIGKIWYAKSNGQYDFFTYSGMHPVDTLKRLKPLTPYILINHVSLYRFLLRALLWSLAILAFIVLLFWNRIHQSNSG